MKIFVIGANGRVGFALVQRLAAKGHQVFAGARKKNEHFSHANIYQIEFDLLADEEQIKDIFQRIHPDAIYFTAGSRGKNLLQIDSFGAVKAINAASQCHIKRFIMLSAVFALRPERWVGQSFVNLKDYYIARFFADHYLVHSFLDYTILQPGSLQEKVGSGSIQTRVTQPLPNSIDNVAETLSVLLLAQNTFAKVITMADGDTPIADAIEQF